jgi:hypothetical protein
VDEITTSPARDRSPAGEAPRPDPATRRAALWATLIAVPVTLAVAGFTFAKLAPDEPAARPEPSATAVRPQSTAPVQMPAPALAERPATVCRALVSQLPDSLHDVKQRPVTAGPEQNAAYGDPAATVACGGTPAIKPCPAPTGDGALPAGCFPDTDEVWRVNRVCWHSVEQADATVLTTVDREIPVQVRVPKEHGPALQWVAPVSDVIVATVPSAKTAPSGCSA